MTFLSMWIHSYTITPREEHLAWARGGKIKMLEDKIGSSTISLVNYMIQKDKEHERLHKAPV